MPVDEKQDLWRQRAHSKLATRLLVKRVAWSFVQATLYRHSFHRADRWRTFLLNMFGAQVAPLCTLRRKSTIYYPWNLTMGALSALGDGCVIYNLGPVSIGERVLLSQECYICAGTHDYRQKAMPLVVAPIALKDDSWICARAFISPGVTIGEGAIVAAAGVVVKDVADWCIVGGNPATFIKIREKPV